MLAAKELTPHHGEMQPVPHVRLGVGEIVTEGMVFVGMDLPRPRKIVTDMGREVSLGYAVEERYRELLWPPVPEGYARESRELTLKELGRTVCYKITDVSGVRA